MTTENINSWQAVQAEVLRRIHVRIWKPGDMIPNEADLAQQLGCARATVNRALRNLSDEGLLERRRKAGTRVALHPVRKATLSIPLIRLEIEERNQSYGYLCLSSERADIPPIIHARMQSAKTDGYLQIKSLHLADGQPFMFEDRWINLSTAPDAANFDFASLSANEWLLTHAPYTRGEISFSAQNANAEVAKNLGVDTATAVFSIERATWDGTRSVTHVRQCFHAGYSMKTSL